MQTQIDSQIDELADALAEVAKLAMKLSDQHLPPHFHEVQALAETTARSANRRREALLEEAGYAVK